MAERDELDLTSLFGDLEERDLSELNGLNAPALSEPEIEKVKDFTIDEVESLEEFQKKFTESQKQVTSTKDNPAVETDEGVPDTVVEVPENETEVETEEDISPIRAIAEWAGTKGIIDFDPEKFEDTEEYLESKLNAVVENKVKSYKEELPEVLHDLINNYEEGVPLMELIDSKSRQMEYSSIEEKALEDDVELQKNVIRQHLSNLDYKEEAIEKKIKRFEEGVMLEEEAKEALEKLKTFEAKYQENLIKETKARKAAAEKEWQDQIKNIEKTIMTADEIIPGVKLSKEDKQKLFDGYIKFDSKRETQLTKAMKADPLANLKIAQFFLLMGGNVSKLKTTLKTEVSKEVKKTVNTYKEKDNPLNKLDLNKIKKAVDLVKKARGAQ